MGFDIVSLETINDNVKKDMKKIFRFGIKDQFVKKYGTQTQLFEHCGISANKIYLKVKKILI